MNVLELVQAVCDELLITRPTTVAVTSDPQTRQLMALLNRLGVDIARQYTWQRLIRENILTTVSIETTGDTTAGSAVSMRIKLVRSRFISGRKDARPRARGSRRSRSFRRIETSGP